MALRRFPAGLGYFRVNLHSGVDHLVCEFIAYLARKRSVAEYPKLP